MYAKRWGAKSLLSEPLAKALFSRVCCFQEVRVRKPLYQFHDNPYKKRLKAI